MDETMAGLAGRLADAVAEGLTDDAAGDLLAPDDQRARAWALIAEQIRGEQVRRIRQGRPELDETYEQELAREAFALLFGLGRLQRWLDDPLVADIEANGCDRVFVRLVDGSRQQVEAVADSDADLIEQIRLAAARLGRSERRFDTAAPALELQLPGGARLFALMELSGRPVLAIRKHQWDLDSLDQLAARGAFGTAMRSFLAAVVAARLNVVISGDPGAGKTTLMRALINQIGPGERLVTIEDSLELGVDRYPDRHPNVVTLEERRANTEGQGAVGLTELVRHSLRLNPDRVFVGEVRGGEVLPMLQAMSQAAAGSMCTVHGGDPGDALSRLQLWARQHHGLDETTSAWLLADAIDVVVHVGKRQGRRVTAVVETRGHLGDRVQLNYLFRPDREGHARPTGVISDGLAARLAEVGCPLHTLVGEGV